MRRVARARRGFPGASVGSHRRNTTTCRGATAGGNATIARGDAAATTFVSALSLAHQLGQLALDVRNLRVDVACIRVLVLLQELVTLPGEFLQFVLQLADALGLILLSPVGCRCSRLLCPASVLFRHLP